MTSTHAEEANAVTPTEPVWGSRSNNAANREQATQTRSCLPGRDADIIEAAEKFLVATAEAVHPDTPASALLQYTIGYRAHLAAIVAATVHSPACSHQSAADQGARCPPGRGHPDSSDAI